MEFVESTFGRYAAGRLSRVESAVTGTNDSRDLVLRLEERALQARFVWPEAAGKGPLFV